MARTSFEDDATAAVMNELFVNIKVDREERPDIDQIICRLLHHLGEQGGWPLTMFLTPKGEPVWGGTYYSENLALRPACVRRCAARSFGCSARAEDKIGQNRDLADGAARRRRPPAGKGHDRRPRTRPKWPARSAGRSDPTNGGLRGAPKFPNSALYELFGGPAARHRQAVFRADRAHAGARSARRHLRPPRRRLLATRSTSAGWCRISKMLYDNAQLLGCCRFCPERQPLFRQRATETVGWLKREMTTPEGHFQRRSTPIRGRRGGQVLRLVPAEIVEAWEPKMLRFLCSIMT